MRRFILTGAILAAAAGGCGGGGGTTAAPLPSPSSASPSPSCEGVDPTDAFDAIRRHSRWTKDGDLDVLVISEGDILCPSLTSADGALVISTTVIRYGAPGTRPKAAAASEPVATYDGRNEVEVPIPVIGTRCLGVAVHAGTKLPADAVPETGFTGTATGPELFRDIFQPDSGLGLGLGLDRQSNPLIAVDSLGGPACTLTVKRK